MTEEKTEQKKSEGIIIKVQSEKGFGFIISDEHKFVKFFFHWTGLTQNTPFLSLKEKMKVRFIPVLNSKYIDNGVQKDRGPRAIQIEVVG